MSERDFAQVSCIVRRGDDPLSISWSFHGSNITSELGIMTTPIGGRGSMLVIPSVGHKHRGTYTCKASNLAGVRTESVELNVNGIFSNTHRKAHFNFLVILLISFYFVEPPDLLPLSFGRDVMDEGSFAQVSCIVNKGDQPLSISWSFHGSNITSDLGITTMPTGPRGSLLMIPSVGHKHRGSYTCKAANSAGVRTQTVELRVNGTII